MNNQAETPIEENPFSEWAADRLIKHSLALKDYIAEQSKQFAEYMAPHNKARAQIDAALQKMFTDQKLKNVKTEFGTAYVSTLLNHKIVDRDAFMKDALTNWQAYGGALMNVTAVTDGVKEFMESHEGKPPPGVEVSWFSRINIRKS